MESHHSLYKSFQYAFEGLKTALQKGRNFKIQLVIALLAILLGIFLKIDMLDWVALTLISTFILVLELINTSIEAIVDLVSPEIKDKAKVAKDVAAASVLLASISSIILAFLIFYNHLITV